MSHRETMARRFAELVPSLNPNVWIKATHVRVYIDHAVGTAGVQPLGYVDFSDGVPQENIRSMMAPVAIQRQISAAIEKLQTEPERCAEFLRRHWPAPEGSLRRTLVLDYDCTTAQVLKDRGMLRIVDDVRRQGLLVGIAVELTALGVLERAELSAHSSIQ